MSRSIPASYCPACNCIATYEPRDEFLGELYCPNCASRTPHQDRGTLAQLRREHPRAELYEDGVSD